MASNLRQKTKLNYKSLHEGEHLRLEGKLQKPTPEVLESHFYVERLITKKKDNGKHVSLSLSQYVSSSYSSFLIKRP